MMAEVMPSPSVNATGRWQYLENIVRNLGPFVSEEVVEHIGNRNLMDNLSEVKILVIGAGGLGCEILKNLALSGFKDIHVIDMDTIDVSNLNRQFLFRQSDVGKFKAECAAAFVEKRVKGVKITPHNCKIQDFDDEFYRQFGLIISGLDSIEARRWINSMLVDLAEEGGDDSIKPLIDGGTEGFKGQARVIVPTITSCFECQLDMHAPRAAVPLCTLANIPRQPEHCIEWAHIIAWETEKPFPKLDNDDPEHITWLFQKALTRAKEFNIPGVTYSLTQGVVKNIIPAIASTNAIIAAACCNEALKLATNCNPTLGPDADNYMMYSGNDGVYTYTFEYEKKTDCPVCGTTPKAFAIDPESTLEMFIENLGTHGGSQLKKPSLRTGSKTLYMQSPASLEEATRGNLSKKMMELVEDGEEVSVSDPAFPTIAFRYRIRYS